MKIQSSFISMSSKSSFTEEKNKSENTKFWIGDKRPNFENKQENLNINIPQDNLKLSNEGIQKLFSQKKDVLRSDEISSHEDSSINDKDKRKIKLLEDFIFILSGKRVKLKIPDLKSVKNDNTVLLTTTKNATKTEIQSERAGWGLEYDLSENHHEKQTMSFSAEGIVKTQAGKEININIQLNMSREFHFQNEVHIRAGDAKLIDPLVLNYERDSVGLSNEKFIFDLDNDGTPDQISALLQGSGFLALDKNNDNKINNGSELFGTQSSNGFADLAEYDSDKNDWIDENDSIFEKLRIWTKDESGNDQLFVLGQKGIGAIYLGNVNSSFRLKDQSNNNMGNISYTGLYLKENGETGTIQHLDLAL